jgi:hypothetical protein
MKDFRLKVVQRDPGLADILELLSKGQLKKALRKARAAGVSVSQTEIDAAANRMYSRGGVSELLALIGEEGVVLPYNIRTLVDRALEIGDYHGLLKQAKRLELLVHYESQVRKAIEAIESCVPREAEAWRRKLGI